MDSEAKMKNAEGAGVSSEDEGAKGRIAMAALGLFCEKGYESTSVREIVEVAGVTKPVLYYYFKNKEDLFRAVIEEVITEHGVLVARVCEEEQADLRSQLEAIEHLYIDRALSERALVRFFNTIAFSGLYDHLVDFQECWRRDLELIAGVFDRAQRQGLIRGDISGRELADHFLGSVVSVMRCAAHFPDLIEGDPLDHRGVTLLLEGLMKRR